MELTVLMPCLNEARTVARCVEAARGFLASAGLQGEVLVADNGSTDGSQELAQAAGARVIEVELRDEFSAGINWQVVLGGLENSVRITQSLAPATSGAFTLALNVGDFTALLNAFATQGQVNVLSSPRVTAMNNEPAVMRIGTQDVFFTTTTQVNPDTGQILQTTVTPQSITEGVVLD